MVMSTKRYLLRGIYDWCIESDLTPYIVAKIIHGVRVPKSHIKSNEIILNLSSNSTENLIFANTFISFLARFEGKSYDIFLPIESISGIYSMENGEGLFFEVDEESIKKRTTKIKQKTKNPHLSLVK